jgi:hypothetical protein
MKTVIFNNKKSYGINIPKRSYLYNNLEPISVGTPYIESLASYISRLSTAHSLKTGVFINKILINQQYLKGNNKEEFYLKNINGFCAKTSIIIEVLEQLTKRNDLKLLTLLKLRNVISERNLFSKKLKWCPICYQQWQNNGQTVYNPLLWNFKIIDVCVLHNRPLKTKCPYCGRQIPVLESKSLPGYCEYCRTWLGSESNEKHILNQAELEFQFFATYNMGELLEYIIESQENISNEVFSNNINKIVEQLFDNSNIKLAKKINAKSKKIKNCRVGKDVIELDSLLRLCYILNVSVTNILFKKLSDNNISAMYDYLYVEKFLTILLNSGSCLPLSLSKVSELVGHSTETLKKYHPELCKALKEKYTYDVKMGREKVL